MAPRGLVQQEKMNLIQSVDDLDPLLRDIFEDLMNKRLNEIEAAKAFNLGREASRKLAKSKSTIGCQTTIDTQTFINILNINKQKANVKESGVQVRRYKGDNSYLYKKKGLDIFDFGQNVDSNIIAREYQLLHEEIKAKRVLNYFD